MTYYLFFEEFIFEGTIKIQKIGFRYGLKFFSEKLHKMNGWTVKYRERRG